MDNIIDKHFQEWLDESNPLNENEPDVRTKLMKYYNSSNNNPSSRGCCGN